VCRRKAEQLTLVPWRSRKERVLLKAAILGRCLNAHSASVERFSTSDNSGTRIDKQ